MSTDKRIVDLEVRVAYQDQGEPFWLHCLASLTGQAAVLVIYLGGRRVVGAVARHLGLDGLLPGGL